jgi:hypothetical protein
LFEQCFRFRWYGYVEDGLVDEKGLERKDAMRGDAEDTQDSE